MADAEIHHQALYTKGVVHICVVEGNEAQHFYIHEDTLQRYATRLVELARTENDGGCAYCLTDVRITTFKAFIQWLDCQQPTTNTTRRTIPIYGSYEDTERSDLLALTRLYIFGFQNGITNVYRDALSKLASYMQNVVADLRSIGYEHQLPLDDVFCRAETCLIYRSPDTADYPLRRFFVDCFCAANIDRHYPHKETLNELPKEFLVDVMIRRTELAKYENGVDEAIRSLENWELYGTREIQDSEGMGFGNKEPPAKKRKVGN